MKKEKTIDMSQYRYYPEDKRKLELNEIIWKMRDFRPLFFLFLFGRYGGVLHLALLCFVRQQT